MKNFLRYIRFLWTLIVETLPKGIIIIVILLIKVWPLDSMIWLSVSIIIIVIVVEIESLNCGLLLICLERVLEWRGCSRLYGLTPKEVVNRRLQLLLLILIYVKAGLLWLLRWGLLLQELFLHWSKGIGVLFLKRWSKLVLHFKYLKYFKWILLSYK